MGEPDQYETVFFKEKMSSTVQEQLHLLVDSLWKEIEQLNEELDPHTYESRRAMHVRAAAVATLCDHKHRESILTSWNQLQETYANAVKTQVKKGIGNCKEMIRLADSEIGDLVPIEKEYNELLESRNPEDLRKIGELAPNIARLEETRNDKEKNERTLDNINLATDHLDAFLALQGIEKIHYVLLSADATLEQLGDGTYDGIPFDPFTVTGSDIKDAFIRESGEEQIQVARDRLALEEVAPELQALLDLKFVVDNYPTSKKFTSGSLAKDLGENYPFGAGVCGGYLERLQETFLVSCEKVAGRRFTKMAGAPVDRETFLARVIENLRPQEVGPVNKFYIDRALVRMREHQRGYHGFTSDDVIAQAEVDKFPLSRQAVGINFSKRMEEYGLVVVDSDQKEKTYRFKEFIPTEKQREAVRKGVPDMGYATFNIGVLFTQTKVPAAVIEHMLEEEGEALGIKKVSKGMYRSTQRPPSAKEQVESTQQDLGANDVF